MAVTALRCKECGTELPARGALRLRAAASARSRSPTTTPGSTPAEAKRQDPGRPARDLALRRLPAVRRAPARSARAGPDAAGPRRPARRAPRPRRGLDQERRRQPDPLVQGPGRRGRARQGARARLRDRRLRLDRQPRQRRRRPRRRRRARLLRLRARRPRGAEAARDRRLRHRPGRRPAATTTTSTGSAPSSRETRPWAFVNVNLRPYYAEGSKTLAYETVEQLGWSLPDRVVCPIASGSLFTKLGRGFSEWLDLGLVEGELPAFNGAQADGLQPGRRRRSPRAGTSASRSARTRSPRASRSATRPTAPTRSTSRAGPAASIDSVTDDEIRDGIRLLAETTGIFTETAGGVTDRGAGEARRARRRSTPTSASSSTSPARA